MPRERQRFLCGFSPSFAQPRRNTRRCEVSWERGEGGRKGRALRRSLVRARRARPRNLSAVGRPTTGRRSELCALAVSACAAMRGGIGRPCEVRWLRLHMQANEPARTRTKSRPATDFPGTVSLPCARFLSSSLPPSTPLVRRRHGSLLQQQDEQEEDLQVRWST